MFRFVALVSMAVVLALCSVAPACDVVLPGVAVLPQGVAVQSHCGVAAQANYGVAVAHVAGVQVQAFAVPAVTVLATPVVVQSHGFAVQAVVPQVVVKQKVVRRVSLYGGRRHR